MIKNFSKEHEAERRQQLAHDRHHAVMDRAARKIALAENLRALKAAEAEYTRAADALRERPDADSLKAFVMARSEKKRLQDERRRLWA